MNRQTNEKTVTRKGLYNQMAFWQLLEEQRQRNCKYIENKNSRHFNSNGIIIEGLNLNNQLSFKKKNQNTKYF